MPPIPGGLTPCDRGKVRTFLRSVLAPHGRDHELRFKTYEGTTRNSVDVTGCGRDDARAQVSAIQANEDTQRQAAATALSDAIDPFTRTVDCSDCTD